MKRIISLVLALMLFAALSVTAFADNTTQTGSITINGISAENTYEIYKLLDLSYNETAGAYSYTTNSTWAAFFETKDAKEYMSIAEGGFASWVAADDDDTKAAFAKLAQAYAKANSISPVKSSRNAGEFAITGASGKFSDLELGYYLIDSTMGALCGLTTTSYNASINAKNGAPTIEKSVKEDDSTAQWGTSNTADIGQTVEYRVTINVHAGAQNYTLHDVMAGGLTYDKVTKIERVISSVETTEVTADKYAVKTGTEITDGCDFEVHFTQDFCDELETNNKLVVYYQATMNEGAVVAGNGNQNTAYLSFGDLTENHRSNESSVVTYTYGADIVKTDSFNKLIDGAEFKIYDAVTGGNEVAVVADGEDYRRDAQRTTGDTIVVKDGQIRVNGLGNGTYYLEETLAPDGYNKLTARQEFIVADGILTAIFDNGVYSTGSGVHVVNNTGAMLPETGGLGTLMFTVLGGSTALGTGVVLVTKKRMSKIEDED